jgi:nucleotide-binding universal stress UspA family protein
MASIASPLDVQVKSVLIATDFSESSEKPLRHALAIARHYGAKFYLAHVVSSLGYTLAGAAALEAATDAVCRDARQLEDQLVKNGALAGLHHEVIVRQGQVWEQLAEIIRLEHVDLVVIGTHGRRGLGKLLLGSIAEQVFRHAECMVLTVGPGSYPEARVERTGASRTFLFPTDLGAASLNALPYAISSANQFGAKLALMHVVAAVPMPEGFHWHTAGDLMQMRESARIAALQQLENLTAAAQLEVSPECIVEFESTDSISNQILETAEKLRVDAIIMGLRRSEHIAAGSHLPWATAYEVVCGAGCPVLTVRE